MMKAKEVRNMSPAELEAKLTDLKKDLFTLRMQHATNQLDNPLKIAEVPHQNNSARKSAAARGLRR